MTRGTKSCSRGRNRRRSSHKGRRHNDTTRLGGGGVPFGWAASGSIFAATLTPDRIIVSVVMLRVPAQPPRCAQRPSSCYPLLLLALELLLLHTSRWQPRASCTCACDVRNHAYEALVNNFQRSPADPQLAEHCKPDHTRCCKHEIVPAVNLCGCKASQAGARTFCTKARVVPLYCTWRARARCAAALRLRSKTESLLQHAQRYADAVLRPGIRVLRARRHQEHIAYDSLAFALPQLKLQHLQHTCAVMQQDCLLHTSVLVA